MSNQLVSVTVISYNSSATILETLESIKNQSYPRLELIISDDCSKDNTVAVCQEWIENNKDRFERLKLLTSDQNQGVCANGNKAKRAIKGEWVKGIAADDILLPNCISDFMGYVNKNKNISFVTSWLKVYNETFDEENCIEEKKGPKDLRIFDQPVEVQLRQMAYSSFIQAPSIFYKKEVFDTVGGYTDKYPYEDHPFYMDVLEHGYKLYFMDKVTVGYRVHQSASHSSNKLFNYQFLQKTHRFKKERCFKYYTKRKKLATYLMWFVEWAMYSLHLDKANSLNRFMYDVQMAILARLGGRVKYKS